MCRSYVKDITHKQYKSAFVGVTLLFHMVLTHFSLSVNK